jgi:hypothetical protein
LTGLFKPDYNAITFTANGESNINQTGVNTMYTTEQIIHAVTTAGCLADLEHNLEIGNTGGVKFIIRACLEIPLAESGWITFGVICDLYEQFQRN